MGKDKRTHLEKARAWIHSEKSDTFAQELERFIGQAVVKKEKERVHDVVIETAVPLSEKEQGTCERIIRQWFGEKGTMTYVVKPLLLGGIRMTIGDFVLDGSLLHQLHQLSTHVTGRRESI